jgi:putative transcriptional regulator
VVVSHSMEELNDHFSSAHPPSQAFAFTGYSGWAANQLEDEMKSGCWITQPASASLIFSPKPEELWQKILHKKGGIYELLAKSPEDPTLN